MPVAINTTQYDLSGLYELGVNTVKYELVMVQEIVAVSGGGEIGVLAVTFDYSDFASGAKVIGTIPSNKTIFRCVLRVNNIFDNGAGVTIGDDTAQARLMALAGNEPDNIADYIEEPDYKYLTSTALKLYLSNSPTQGSGEAIIYFN